MQIISMKQLREQFEPIRDGLENGETYLLMYRSKPLATLLPYEPTKTTRPRQPSPSPIPPSVSTTPTAPQPATSLQKFGLKKMLSPK